MTDTQKNDYINHIDLISQSKNKEKYNTIENKIEKQNEQSGFRSCALPRDGILDSLRGLFRSDHFNTSSSSTANDETETYAIPSIPKNYASIDTGEKSFFNENEKHITQQPKIICDIYEVGIASILDQWKKSFLRHGVNFTLLVAGQAGLGKTTFINTLFGTEVVPTVWDKEKNIKELLATTQIDIHSVEVVDDEFKLNFKIVDTPGFGIRMDNAFTWTPVVNYIDAQHRSFMLQEEQPYRSAKQDNRVHCCLYFIKISDNGPSLLDITAMKEISKRCNLIPIIPKSDSYTVEEKSNYKNVIRKILREKQIKVCSLVDENEEGMNTIMKDFPFALICSQDLVKNSEGKEVRGRAYRWGVAEVDNPQHSDFSGLRGILFSSSLLSLVEGTENYYEFYRSQLLLSRINQAKKNSVKDSKLLSLDFNNPEKNGLGNYWIYEIYNRKFIDSLVVEWSPEFIHKKSESQKKLNDKVLSEERRFKQWKTELISMQNTLNQEIENIYKIVKTLDAECKEMENQLDMYNSKRFSKLH